MTTPDIAGLCEKLRNGADAIDSDGTPAQAGPYPDELREAADTLERQAAEIGRLREAMEGLVDDLERRHRQVAEVCDEMQQQANDGYSYHRLVGKQAAYHHAAELAYQALSYKG